ncbi:MAG TPA: universal stress protein [Gaiellaceae bacterium]|jgi:Universal stress protein UspA and related nucleotide-binding proteins|nr:universal stress protein [Gaiellaceae bacterium]
MKVIVVGVDGSDHSVLALRYALRAARVTDAVVRAVNVWHVPSLAYGAGVAPVGNLAEDLPESAEATLEQALASVAEEIDGVTVQRLVREGDAGHVLVAESEGAQQLIVGSRGHGSIGELVLGSVSHYCCRHAHCPVTVIPHTATPV